ncbi:MAG: stage V sporulation protein AD [Oscillospiraceae bacterium]|nr:stage V sporulation protein AD [Oscillospiraceae bacterium]
MGKYTILFKNPPNVKGSASVCGKKEGEGPLGEEFDEIFDDSRLGEDSFEKAESKLQSQAVKLALKKSQINTTDVNMIFSGDLLNQCSSSTFGLRSLQIPFVGQFGACSTMAQTIIMSSIMIASGAANYSVAVTSSHFCAAERQYRFPLEYGCQRFQTAQWTVTGSGAAVIEKDGTDKPYILGATVGKIIDLGVKDTTNMGAAMAPAAADTLKNFLSDTNTSASDYDLILTGDLGEVGSKLLKELLSRENIKLSNNHNDCGLIIFDKEKQDVHSGGSGCGCSGSVLCSAIFNKMRRDEIKNLLFVATGALMSPTSSQQGESIPSIAHLVWFSNDNSFKIKF